MKIKIEKRRKNGTYRSFGIYRITKKTDRRKVKGGLETTRKWEEVCLIATERKKKGKRGKGRKMEEK